MTSSLAHAAPPFLAAEPLPSECAGDDAATLRTLEHKLAQYQPADSPQPRQAYFCTQCLAKCESDWDIIAGPHTGHSCLPLTTALQVLPSALKRQVTSDLRSWQESFEKPRMAQALQLDEQMNYLRTQRTQKLQALARLQVELAETERGLEVAVHAKAIAACNWRYQQTRMLQQLRRWRKGCDRLSQEVGQQRREAATEAWSHGWEMAERELAALSQLLDMRLAAWAAEEAATHEAIQHLVDEQQQQQQPLSTAVDRETEEEQKSIRVDEETTLHTGCSRGLTFPFTRESQTTGLRGATLKRTQPHVVSAASPPLSPSPCAAASPIEQRNRNRHHHHHHHNPSLNEFVVLEQRPTQRSPAASSTSAEDVEERTERQRRLAAKERALCEAFEALLGPRETATVAPPPLRPEEPATKDRSSRSSSLSSLQQQLLEDLQRTASAAAAAATHVT